MPLISFLSFQTRRYRKRTNEKMQQNTRDLKSGLNLNKYARNRTQFDAISACRSNKKKNHIVLQVSITQSYCWSSLSQDCKMSLSATSSGAYPLWSRDIKRLIISFCKQNGKKQRHTEYRGIKLSMPAFYSSLLPSLSRQFKALHNQSTWSAAKHAMPSNPISDLLALFVANCIPT